MKSKNKTIILLLIISLSFSIKTSYSNTQYVEFTIYIDRTNPEYFYKSINETIINNYGEMIEISAYWTDDRQLGKYYYESNITGSFENLTYSFIDGWSNQTLTFTNAEYEGRNVSYRLIGFDIAGNINATEYNYFSITKDEPKYSNLSQSIDEITAGENITLSSYWTDNFNIKNATLWYDDGLVEDISIININELSSWTNYTLNTTGFGSNVNWTIKAFDSAHNYNETALMNFTVI